MTPAEASVHAMLQLKGMQGGCLRSTKKCRRLRFCVRLQLLAYAVIDGVDEILAFGFRDA